MNAPDAGRDSLEEALVEFQKGILPIVNYLAPESDREDILHDVLLKAVHHLSDCHVDRKAWAAKIARREVYSRTRRQRVHARALQRMAEWKEQETSDAPSAPEETRELAREIEEASRSLTWPQWRVWTLIDVMELDAARACRITGDSHSAVRTLLHRARRQLRSKLLHLRLSAG